MSPDLLILIPEFLLSFAGPTLLAETIQFLATGLL